MTFLLPSTVRKESAGKAVGLVLPPKGGLDSWLKAARSVVVKQRSPTSTANFRYEHPDLDDDPQEDRFAIADLELSKHIAETIELHYPGHPWQVDVSHQTGIVKISIPALMGGLNCYVVHVSDCMTDPSLRAVKRGCGEILERYRLSRARYDRDDFAKAATAMPYFLRKDAAVPV